jgi:hypothetical protein
MQKLIILLAILSLGLVGTAQKSTDKKPAAKEKGKVIKPINHFREIFWGSNSDSTYVGDKKVEFVFVSELKGEKFYQIENDDMTIGSVTLKKINYVFDKENRFTKVVMEGDKKDAQAMNFILENKYGKPLNEDKTDEVEYFEWLVKGVKILFAEHALHKFETVISNNMEAIENYKKNTHVDDF